jgi:hypothetical protein
MGDMAATIVDMKLGTNESINERSLKVSNKIRDMVKSFNNTAFLGFQKITSGGERIDFEFKATKFAKEGVQRELEKMFPKANVVFVNKGNHYKVGILGKGVTESINEAGSKEPQVIQDLRWIVDNKQNKKVKDPKTGKPMRVDLFSASHSWRRLTMSICSSTQMQSAVVLTMTSKLRVTSPQTKMDDKPFCARM